MIIGILSTLGAAIGPILLRMGLAFLSKSVIEEAIIDLLGYLIRRYKNKAAESADPLDDERAKRLELIYNTWKDALGRLDAKGG